MARIEFNNTVADPLNPNTMLLDGSADLLSVPDFLDTTQDWSATAWFYMDSIGTDQTILSDFPLVNPDVGIIIRYSTGGSDRVRISANNNLLQAEHTVTLVTGTWYFVHATYNTVDGYTIGIDGTSSANVSTAANNVSEPFFIGALSSAALSQNLAGSLTGLNVFNRTITVPEIAELYNAGTPKQPWDYSNTLRDSYVLALPLNNGLASGREFQDFSGSELDPTLIGAPTITGARLAHDASIVYDAFGFDGTDDYINVGQDASITLGTGDKSHSIWFKTSSTGTHTFFGQDDVTDFYWIYIEGGRIIVWAKDGGVQRQYRSDLLTYNTGLWSHLVVLWNSFGTFEIYIDGALIPSTINVAGAPTNVANSGTDTHIGVNGTLFGYFDGSLTQPMMFDRTLTAEEIAIIYNQNSVKLFTNLPSKITDSSILALEMTSNDATLTDLSTNTNDGTVNGGATSNGAEMDFDDLQAPEIFGTLLLNGTTQYLDAGNDASLNIVDDFTCTAWINTNSHATYQCVFGKWITLNQKSFYFGTEITTGNLVLILSTNGTATTSTHTTTLAVPINTWTFITCRMTGGNIYVSMNAGTEQSFAQTTLHSSTSNLLIGTYENGIGDFVNGSLASVKVFNIALPAPLITDLYNAGVPKVHRAYNSVIRDNCVLAIEGAEDLNTALEQTDFDALTNNQFHMTDGTLTDLSANAYAITNSGTTQTSGYLNNKDVTDFDGSSHFTVGALSDFIFLHLDQGKSVFVVVQTDVATDNQGVISTSFGSSAQTGFDYWINGASNQHRLLIGDGVPAAPLDYIAATSSMTSRWMIVEFSGSTTVGSLIYEDSTSIANSGTSSAGEDLGDPLNVLNIGRFSDGSVNFDGRIADIVLFDAEQTGDNKQVVLSRLVSKYFPLRDSSNQRNTVTEVASPLLIGSGLDFNATENTESLALANTAVLNGTTQWFDAGNVVNAGTSDFSLSCWFKSTSAASQRIISKTNAGPFYSLYLEGGTIVCRTFVSAGNQRVQQTTAATFDDGNWHHAIIFSDRSAGTQVIYIDGVLEPSSSVLVLGVVTATIDNADSLIIGARNTGSPFDGELAFPMISIGSDLTADATELYNGGIPKCWDDLLPATQSKISYAPSLVTWKDSINPIVDRSPSNITTTIVGEVPFTGSGLAAECSETMWTPAQDLTMRQWIDANDSNTTDEISGEYESITDKSVNGLTITAPSVARRPTVGYFNGLNAIDILVTQVTGEVLRTGSSVIGTNDDYTMIATFGSGSSTIGRGADLFGNGWSMYLTQGGEHNVVLTSGGATAFLSNSGGGGLMSGQLDQGNTLRSWSNGGSLDSEVVTMTSLRTSTLDLQYVACNNDGSKAGQIGEAVVFTSLISTANRQLIEGYLAWKWGLVNDLVSSHRYKLIAPRADGAQVPNTLLLDGTTQYITVTDDASLDFDTTDHAITGWINTLDTPGSPSLIISKRATAGDLQGYEVSLETDGRLGVRARQNAGADVQVVSLNVVNDGQWHSFIANFDRDANLELYVDEDAVQTASIAAVGTLDNTSNLIVGADNSLINWFSGSVASIKVYDSLLDAGERTEIINAAGSYVPKLNTLYSAPLIAKEVAAWEFAEDIPADGQELEDQSGLNDGTATGSPAFNGNYLGFQTS